MAARKGLLNFTVDSHLLRELGERLVGRPYIALAELVKNSYDADATRVTIAIDKGADVIIVSDNGHGMSFDEFEKYWMRIGSTHKGTIKTSRRLGRNLTGSKGIGRLSAQFLANGMKIVTCSDQDSTSRVTAEVDWREATQAGELTTAKMDYTIEGDGPYENGTTLHLKGLNHVWTDADVDNLASEIWWLQPPFRYLTDSDTESKNAFNVSLEATGRMVRAFDSKMQAIHGIWWARIVGTTEHGDTQMTVQFADGKPRVHKYRRENCAINFVDFEIRIYHLVHRQPGGIKVGQAREYLARHGGVHIYNAGFRLPYYGDPKNDWLGIELDHALRLDKSKYLPPDLLKGVRRAMQFLPSLYRVLGIVNVDTVKDPDLEILVTRDRFRDSKALEDLRWIVRYAVDYYALLEQLRNLRMKERQRDTLARTAKKLEDVLDDYRDEITPKVLDQLRNDVTESVRLYRTEAEVVAEKVGLMGSLATAGIIALAYQHEMKFLFKKADTIADDIRTLEARISNTAVKRALSDLEAKLRTWTRRARETNALFTHIAEPENIENRLRLPAKRTIDEIWHNMHALMKDVEYDSSQVAQNVYLPTASFAEWTAILQNVFLNAYNAMLLSKPKRIAVSFREKGRNTEVLVQDNGHGIDLERAEEFFQPFKREFKIPEPMKAAGYGGSGMGLTIVRAIADGIGCDVHFVKPDKTFKTAFSITWRESG